MWLRERIAGTMRFSQMLSFYHQKLIPVAVLAGAMFFRMFGVFVALPIAAIFAASLSGGDKAWAVGLAVGSYGVTQAIMQIPTGVLADRWGRKPVLVGALLIFAMGGFVAAAADTVWLLMIGRLLQGGGAVASVTAAWIADVTAPSWRGRAMLGYGAAIALAFATSIILAAPLTVWAGLDGIFALAGGLGLVSAAAVLLLPSPPQERCPPAAPLIINRDVALYAAGAFVAHYALSSLFLLLPPKLQNLLPLAEHWHLYAPAFLLSLLFGVPLVWKEKRHTLIGAGFLTAAGLGVALTSEALWSVGFGLFLFFAGFIALEALVPARTSKSVAANIRGAAMGVVMTAEFAGMFAGAAVSGILITIVGAGMAVAVAVLLIFIWAGWCFAVK